MTACGGRGVCACVRACSDQFCGEVGSPAPHLAPFRAYHLPVVPDEGNDLLQTTEEEEGVRVCEWRNIPPPERSRSGGTGLRNGRPGGLLVWLSSLE